MNHLRECDVSASSSNLIRVSLSLSSSPEMFLIREPWFCRIKVEVLGVMWPLTSDLSVCKLIMQDRSSVCGVLLFVLRGRPQGGEEKVPHLSQPTQLNTHEDGLGIIKEAPSTESLSPRPAHRSRCRSREKAQVLKHCQTQLAAQVALPHAEYAHEIGHGP